eukprot:3420034-Rhodomonas_salina.3
MARRGGGSRADSRPWLTTRTPLSAGCSNGCVSLLCAPALRLLCVLCGAERCCCDALVWLYAVLCCVRCSCRECVACRLCDVQVAARGLLFSGCCGRRSAATCVLLRSRADVLCALVAIVVSCAVMMSFFGGTSGAEMG